MNGPVLEIEVTGREQASGAPDDEELAQLCALGAASAGIEAGHLAIAFVSGTEIARLNADHRGRAAPTDVLSFPVDGGCAAVGPRELGDIVICPAHTTDIRRAVVHGVLHLVGMDHETDRGEMLALQAELLRWTAPPAATAPAR